MPYIANQYNYCTPLSGAANLTDSSVVVRDVKYFTLFDNVLDGTYVPVSGDVGLWGNTLADSSGVLSSPFAVTVDESINVRSITVTGSVYSYPVDFTIQLYNGSTLLYTHNVVGNTLPIAVLVFPAEYTITRYVITVSKISSYGVARLYSSYKTWYVQSTDTLRLKPAEGSPAGIRVSATVHDTLRIAALPARKLDVLTIATDTLPVKLGNTSSIRNIIDKDYDTLRLRLSEVDYVRNTIDRTHDSFNVALREDITHVINTAIARDALLCGCFDSVDIESSIENIHTAMKNPTRQIFGRVHISYMDPILEATTAVVTASDEAYNSAIDQVTDGDIEALGKYFVLYDNDLTGDYIVSSSSSQVGWTSSVLSDDQGYFGMTKPSVLLEFRPRPFKSITVYFDKERGNVIRDFDVAFMQANGNVVTVSITDNNATHTPVILDNALADVVSIQLTAIRTAKPNSPAAIIDIPAISEFIYAGYESTSDLVSIDLLEELTYNDEIEALGGISANEVTVTLDNTDRGFNFNNPASPIASQLKRNRKIQPYLGTEITPGLIEWYKLGTYWSYSWDVPYDSLVAKVIGFDTLGLLDLTSYTNHQVLTNRSLGELIDYVLNDAKITFPFLTWVVDDTLYDVIIPYAWFAKGSHTAALRKISEAYPMHVYCDRDGQICAVPQKLRVNYYYDVWSDSTNVIDKTYKSLYTVVPNLINVSVISPALRANASLVSDAVPFNVSDLPTRTLNFNEPYVSDISVVVDCDSSVSYTYDTFSWGAVFTFTGTGMVRSIECTGTALDTTQSTTVTRRDEDSILTNGTVTRDISADFIQSSSLAVYLLNRLTELSELDKYDVEVNYRGDIALSINDPILLLDGIAPSNRYTIKRHRLYWDGSLSGTAELNT